MNITYKHGAAQKSDKQMIIIYSDAIDCHSTMMIIFDTTSIAHWAVMHPWQFINLAFLAKSPPLGYSFCTPHICFHEVFRKVVIMKNELVSVIVEWRMPSRLKLLSSVPEMQRIPSPLIRSHLNWCISFGNGI